MSTPATRSPARPRKREAATVPAPASVVEIQLSRDEIARRAFEKFAARGHVHGFDEQDWFDAEDELKAESRERLH